MVAYNSINEEKLFNTLKIKGLAELSSVPGDGWYIYTKSGSETLLDTLINEGFVQSKSITEKRGVKVEWIRFEKDGMMFTYRVGSENAFYSFYNEPKLVAFNN